MSCRDWAEKTDAREALRDDLEPKFRQLLEDTFNGEIPPEAEEILGAGGIREAVDDAVDDACTDEAEDFKPYDRVVETQLNTR